LCRHQQRDPSTLTLSHNATVIIARDDAEVSAKVSAYAEARGLGVAQARERLAHALVGPPEHCERRLRVANR
jgi:alkanesulfonate monooxygenase SsuD/methylene tetrahydromethanopterin reductase-like flavin-dependent oxidoreductase (luciferase family)